MEECIFGHANLDPNQVEQGDWTERQYEQLKSQIQAYKYLIENKPVPGKKTCRKNYPNTKFIQRKIRKSRLHHERIRSLFQTAQ